MKEKLYKKLALGIAVIAGVLILGQVATARIYNPISATVTGLTNPLTADIDASGFAGLNFASTTVTATTTTGALSLTTADTGIKFQDGTYLRTTSGLITNPLTADLAGGGFAILNVASTTITATSTIGAIELSVANSGIKFQDGTYIYSAPVTGASSTLYADLNEFTALNIFANSTSTLGTIDTFWSTTLTNSGTASTTSLFVSDAFATIGNKKIYPRWQGGGSLVQPTTTDEVYKPMINCLESSGPSVTIDKVDAIIASTTYTGTENTEGLSWNINIAAFPASSSPMTLFSAPVNTNSTSSMSTYSSFGTATIPSGYCYWLNITSASTSQIGVFNVNLRGHEN